VIYSEYSMIQYDIAKTIFTDDIYCNPSGSYKTYHVPYLGLGLTIFDNRFEIHLVTQSF
jgi:hypothetical protein